MDRAAAATAWWGTGSDALDGPGGRPPDGRSELAADVLETTLTDARAMIGGLLDQRPPEAVASLEACAAALRPSWQAATGDLAFRPMAVSLAPKGGTSREGG
jgi:hypothetical protein